MKIAFVSTSFGFGPVSKAAYIAQALGAQSLPDTQLTFLGAGIAYDFAKKSACFAQLINLNVDQYPTTAVSLLQTYDLVINVMNLDILAQWAGSPPLVMVDSLGWLWEEIPVGAEKADVYFLQDYLLSPARWRAFQEKTDARLVPPIVTEQAVHVSRENYLVVNFSGADNPFTNSVYFEQYVQVVGQAILNSVAQVKQFDHVYFAVNQQLATRLQQNLAPQGTPFVCAHYAHKEFLHLIARCQLLFTTPGITTTLEALALQTAVVFLLPQNYSQALIAERYYHEFGYTQCMALSQFSPAFAVDKSLPETEGVSRVNEAVTQILSTPAYQQQLEEFALVWQQTGDAELDNLLPVDINQERGQQIIVSELIRRYIATNGN